MAWSEEAATVQIGGLMLKLQPAIDRYIDAYARWITQNGIRYTQYLAIESLAFAIFCVLSQGINQH